MSERSWPAGRRARWTARSALHHSTRQLFAGLGSRADRLPAGGAAGDLARRAVRRGGRRADGGGQPRGAALGGGRPALDKEGPAPLEAPVPGMAARERLHVAVVIPGFGRGSGGHSSIFQIVHWLERMGHTCSLWVFDPLGRNATERASVLRHRIVSEFVPLRAPVFKGFAEWHGADVVVATGLGDRLPDAAASAAAALAPTWCTTTSRSSSGPPSSGSGRSGPTTRTSTRSRAARGCDG